MGLKVLALKSDGIVKFIYGPEVTIEPAENGFTAVHPEGIPNETCSDYQLEEFDIFEDVPEETFPDRRGDKYRNVNGSFVELV